MNDIRKITKYVHRDNTDYEEFWDYDAPQQKKAHYWLYETRITLEVDMKTGDALITHVNGIELKEKTPA